MNSQEALLLCRYAKAAAPHQHMDEYTPDAWFDLLEDLNYEDARVALRNHLRRNQYVAPCDIREGVTEIRQARHRAHPSIEITNEMRREWERQAREELGDDLARVDGRAFRLEQAWHTDALRRIGDGEDLSQYATKRAIRS